MSNISSRNHGMGPMGIGQVKIPSYNLNWLERDSVWLDRALWLVCPEWHLTFPQGLTDRLLASLCPGAESGILAGSVTKETEKIET